MKLFGHEIEGFAQWLVFLVLVLLVASGLCGVQWAILTGAPGSSNTLTGLFMITGTLELAVMVLSAIGVAVVLIAWSISAIIANFRARPANSSKNEIQPLPEERGHKERASEEDIHD